MKYLIIFLLALIIMDCILGIINSLRVNKIIHYYDDVVHDFLQTYYRFRDVLNTDYDAEKILKVCNLENNFLKFGFIEFLYFQDAKELRENMLHVGEFIIKYSESLKYYYDYQGDVDEYNCSLEALREIRRICMSKGENANRFM